MNNKQAHGKEEKWKKKTGKENKKANAEKGNEKSKIFYYHVSMHKKPALFNISHILKLNPQKNMMT